MKLVSLQDKIPPHGILFDKMIQADHQLVADLEDCAEDEEEALPVEKWIKLNPKRMRPMMPLLTPPALLVLTL